MYNFLGVTFLVILLHVNPSFAQDQSEFKSVARPIFNAAATPNFQFSYQVSNAAPGSPVLIFFQGGPGGPVLGGQFPDIFPKDYSVFLFDPRGTGLSQIDTQYASDPKSASSLQIAQDVLAAIKQENIKDYAIWANSYGTVPATIFSYLVSQDPTAPKPKAVVLEGTVGRAFRQNPGSGTHEVASGYQQVLNAVSKTLANQEKDAFKGKIARLQIDQKTVDNLFLDVVASGVDRVASFVKEFDQEKDDVTAGKMKAYKKSKEQFAIQQVGKDFRNQMQIIACNEIIDFRNSGLGSFSFPIFDGRIKFANSYPECDGAPAKPNLYDSSDYQISSSIPVIYIVAQDDPNTPAFQTQYHFDGQRRKNTNTTVIKTPSGGHFPLQGGPLVPCRSEFWSDVNSNRVADGIAALKKCLR